MSTEEEIEASDREDLLYFVPCQLLAYFTAFLFCLVPFHSMELVHITHMIRSAGSYIVFFLFFRGFFPEVLQDRLASKGVLKAAAVDYLKRCKINMTATHIERSKKL